MCLLLASCIGNLYRREMVTSAMYPNIKVGEIVKFEPAETYTYGDMIVFQREEKNPYDGTTKMVDRMYRIVGMPGDRIKIKDNECIVNGVANPCKLSGTVPNDQIPDWYEGSPAVNAYQERLPDGKVISVWKYADANVTDSLLRDRPEIIIPQGHYYVLGDFRSNANDSRATGTVPHESIRGKVKK